MPQIMQSMIFQQSRRKLLSKILEALNATEEKRREREEKASDQGLKEKPEDFNDEDEKRYIDGLGRAVDAGESEVRKLEYWSDIKKAQEVRYSGVENAPEDDKDVDDSDYEYADIWKVRRSTS